MSADDLLVDVSPGPGGEVDDDIWQTMYNLAYTRISKMI
jgi:hypothetical protein